MRKYTIHVELVPQIALYRDTMPFSTNFMPIIFHLIAKLTLDFFLCGCESTSVESSAGVSNWGSPVDEKEIKHTHNSTIRLH